MLWTMIYRAAPNAQIYHPGGYDSLIIAWSKPEKNAGIQLVNHEKCYVIYTIFWGTTGNMVNYGIIW